MERIDFDDVPPMPDFVEPTPAELALARFVTLAVEDLRAERARPWRPGQDDRVFEAERRARARLRVLQEHGFFGSALETELDEG